MVIHHTSRRNKTMPLWSEDDSRSTDSVLDWGSMGSGGKNREESLGVSTMTSAEGLTTSKNKHVSRYNPGSMIRITDINDLVDSSEESDDDDSIVGKNASSVAAGSDIEMSVRRVRRQNIWCHSQRKAGPSPWCRQAIILVSLIGIIAAASMSIGWIVVYGGSSRKTYSIIEGGDGAAARSSPQQQQQQLLEIAERVVLACSESALDEDMSGCQKLCHSSMCCFEEGEYSCEDDESKDCAVYAGCEALIEGIMYDAAEEDEE